MENKGTLFAVLFLILSAAGGTGFYLFYDKYQLSVQQQEEIEQLRQDIRENTQEFRKAQSDLDALHSEKLRLENQVNAQSRRSLSTEEESQKEIVALQDTIEQLETEYTNKITALEQRLEASPPQGEQHTIEQLNSQIDTQKQQLEALAGHNAELQEQLETMRLEQQSASTSRNILPDKNREEFHKALEESEKEKALLFQSLKKREQTIDELIQQMIESQKLIAGLQEQIQEIRKQLLSRLTEKASIEQTVTTLTKMMAENEKSLSDSFQPEFVEQLQHLAQQLENVGRKISLQDAVYELQVELEAEKAKAQRQYQHSRLKLVELSKERGVLLEQVATLQQQLQEKNAELKTAGSADEAEPSELQLRLETLIQEKDARIAELELALEERSDTPDDEQLAALQQRLDESAVQEEELQKGLATLQEENKRLNAELNESQAGVTMLEANLQSQEEESRKQQEAHQQALASLQEAIQHENLEKESIQERLQQELERSEQEYQKQLDVIAEKKQEELEKKDAEVQKFKSIAATYQNLAQDLKEEIAQQSITLEQFKERLTVTLVNKIVFDTGSAEINSDGIKVLKRVGELLKGNLEGRVIRVEGHTDSQIIGRRLKKLYPSNWDLSAARAVNVVRYLEREVRIPSKKLYAVGFGAQRPIATNKTERGRALNRRIEIVLFPEIERSRTQE